MGIDNVDLNFFPSRKAQLVFIAHDVDLIELLCRKLEVPCCIVKGKALLGLVSFLHSELSLMT